MEELFYLNFNQLLVFALVLMRMIGFVVAMPVIGTSNIPSSIKVLLSLALTCVLFPQINQVKLSVDLESLRIITLIIKELFLGLCFGFISRLFFATVSMAGQIMSVSLGLSAAQLFNPALGETASAIDQFYITLASMFFLAINAHHVLISGLFDIYKLVPISESQILFTPFGTFGMIVQSITEIALKLSTPIMISILFMNVAVAVVGRAVPQINILITSLPINILSGFVVLIISLPLLIWQMSELVNYSTTEILNFFKAIY